VMEPKDISKEEWREYDFGDRVYRVNSPRLLWIGTVTHRVLDGDGIVHCCPSPGEHGCVLRWKPKDVGDPVQF
jgi:hypothetical protein